jgi:hypothetical protein
MDDHEIIGRIDRLVEEEHELRSKSDGLSDDEKTELRRLEEGLDQCWDLLRQRRARREMGDDPEGAKARDVGTVEGYKQ